MAQTANRSLAESAVRALNDKCEALGLARRFELDPGSSAKGIRHKLLERRPELVHPVASTSIGRTYAEALKYLNAMNHALLSVVAERDSRRSALGSATPAGGTRTLHDPDAREVRRVGETTVYDLRNSMS